MRRWMSSRCMRAGAILPKIPDDVMTLVPPEESGNTLIKSLDDRRVYELWPDATDFKSDTITDFEGRTLSRTANSLEINGHAARVTVRWRFDPVTSVTLGDTPLELHIDAGGRYVEFNHTGRSMVQWK
jgi:alpha-D-xyloside xylohydrolase